MKWTKTSFFFPLAIISFFTSAQAHAQDTIHASTYLFDTFINGAVRMKSGALEQAPLNYNVLNHSVSFLKDERPLELTGLDGIDTVYVQGKTFVPHDGIFYEVIGNAPLELYATYTGKERPLTATAEHDRSVRQASSQVSNTVSDVYVTRQFRPHYELEVRAQYWVKRYRDFYKINNEKQVIKLFPKKEAAIRTFVATHKTNFHNPEDLKQLLAFCHMGN